MEQTNSQAAKNVSPSASEAEPHQPANETFVLSRQALKSLPATVQAPAYDPAAVTAGIVHLGTGNFALAHLASFVDDLLAHDPSWGIVATSIRTDGTISALRKQDGMYVLVVRENGKRTHQVLAPVVETMFGPENPEALAKRVADENIKLVTVTVSNKGYCLSHGGLDLTNHDIVHDLAMPGQPRSIYGYLARGLAHRRQTGKPLTIMSLDNIEMNSKQLKGALLQFIKQVQPDLVDWVEENVAFPVTLVDRITPETTDGLRTVTREAIGFDSSVVVATESFRQLVVERSSFESPDWSKVGVQVVDDCSMYWQRKFFALNAGHQVVAIPAQRLGVTYIHEAMSHSAVARLLERAHEEWLTFLPGSRDELLQYTGAIRRRFADDALGDTVQRVAARATSKVSERLLASVEHAHAATGKVLRVPTFVSAVWLYNLGREDEFGEHIVLNDADAEKLQHVHEAVVEWVRGVDANQSKVPTDKVRGFLLSIAEALGDARFARMANVDAFVEELTSAIVHIHRLGVEQAIDSLLVH